MSVFKRGKYWHVEVDWQGTGRIRASTKTKIKKRAQAMESSLRWLYDRGRYDLLGLLKARMITLPNLHEAFNLGPDALDQLRTTAESPALGILVDEWLAWLRSPDGISPRPRRPYAPETIRRYQVSWEGFFEVFREGRLARLADITDGLLADYRVSRVRAEGGNQRNKRADDTAPSASTFNRDFTAMQSFMRWCREDRQLEVPPVRLRKQREPEGLERWLSVGEIVRLEEACPQEWWPLFATLLHTGIRVDEAQGLRWEDLRLGERRLLVHEGSRRLKTASSVRVVPLTVPLALILENHKRRVPSSPRDLVFPERLGNYGAARREWRKVCLAGGIHDGGKPPSPNATMRDLRHTYGVIAAQAGVPLPRIQKLMGHATPHMTMRYMKHAPEAYFEEDAAKIATAIAGRSSTGPQKIEPA